MVRDLSAMKNPVFPTVLPCHGICEMGWIHNSTINLSNVALLQQVPSSTPACCRIPIFEELTITHWV